MKINKTITLAAALAVVALSSCKKSADTTATDENATIENVEVVAVTDDPVIDLTNDDLYAPGNPVDQLTILDFNATWCGPCKKLTPSFHQAAKDFAGKATFVNVDVDKNPNTANAFLGHFGVDGIPFVVVVEPNGEMTPFLGLNPFVEGLDIENPNLTADELNAAILANITKIVNSKL